MMNRMEFIQSAVLAVFSGNFGSSAIAKTNDGNLSFSYKGFDVEVRNGSNVRGGIQVVATRDATIAMMVEISTAMIGESFLEDVLFVAAKDCKSMLDNLSPYWGTRNPLKDKERFSDQYKDSAGISFNQLRGRKIEYDGRFVPDDNTKPKGPSEIYEQSGGSFVDVEAADKEIRFK